jgi:hypothetical protein
VNKVTKKVAFENQGAIDSGNDEVESEEVEEDEEDQFFIPEA